MSDFYAQLEQQLIDAGRRRGERGRLQRTLAGRGRMLTAAGTLAVTAVLAVIVFVTPLQREAAQRGQAASPAVATDLRGIRVAVLNATTQPGVARATAAVLGARHARVTAVGNADGRHLATTRVLHRRGARGKARAVARVLGVDRVSPYRGTQRGVARAEVIVLVGADRRDRAGP